MKITARKNLWLAHFVLITIISCSSTSNTSDIPNVTIDISDAQALFIISENSSSTLKLQTSSEEALGTLRKIMIDGTIQPVISYDIEGQTAAFPIIETGLFVGLDNKVYIIFSQPGVVVQGKNCYFVRSTVDGEIEC